ncbi:alpha/beta fold hydrolase [Vibrio furnissii]|uniref:alpha/beta fold hydrolase n=1 Tax=Vibrio furnissii TaxID=29494 RepID=UPI0025727229|nr:alpha/beta fold hydrolase [Vibrio furnissii]WJG26567.1 alpha/beta fold hydrolase [Vibrio furnissii]
MHTFNVDGQQMRYQDVGQGDVIVLGHSYLWDSTMWAPQVAALSQQYRCIVPDMWAHGESDSAPAAMRNLTDYAQHVLALMDHLDIETFSVVGLSVGGMWGAELVDLAPQRVKALVMMDTFIGLEPEVTHAKYFQILDTISQLQAVPEPLVEVVTPMFFAREAAQKTPALVQSFRSRLAALRGTQAVEVARIGRMVFDRRDLMEDVVEKFALPVLVAVGAEDAPRPVLESYLMHDSITGSELVVVPEAGHISNLEQPQFVTDMLTRFLAKVQA